MDESAKRILDKDKIIALSAYNECLLKDKEELTSKICVLNDTIKNLRAANRQLTKSLDDTLIILAGCYCGNE